MGAVALIEWMAVFADGPRGGNPCPVVFDFDATTAQMQAMTADFGVETVFVLAGSSSAEPAGGDRADAELRYFVPRHEMEMCVHATIAASVLLAEAGRCARNPARMKTVLGVVDVEWDVPNSRAVVSQFPPVFGDPIIGVARSAVLQALNIKDRDVDDDTGPIRSVSTARPKLMIPLVNESTLDGLRPDFERLWDVCDELDVTGFYPFTRLDRSKGAFHATGIDAAARQFPRRSGYNEDPATGVAACGLGAYLTAQSLTAQPAQSLPTQSTERTVNGWQSWRIAQGRAMGRPSLITAEALANERGQIVQTRVGGAARRLGPDEARSL